MPEEDGRCRAVRSPILSHGGQIVGADAGVGARNALPAGPQSEITRGPDIGAPHAEHQVNFSRPVPYAPEIGQERFDVIVAFLAQGPEAELLFLYG